MRFNQILINEIRRLLRNKKIWILFVIMLILNAAVMFVNDSKEDVVPAEYKQIKRQVLQLDMGEQLQILDALAQQDEADMILAGEDGDDKNTAAMQLLTELNIVAGYREYLDKIQTEAAENQTLSIFKNSKYALNNLKKTAKDYLPLASVSPSLAGGYGLSRVLAANSVNICILFLMAVLVMYSILEEKKSGVLELYESAQHGRGELCLAKMLSVILFTGFISLVFFMENVGYALYAYGMLDFNGAIQSLYGYEQCVFCISIGQFLVCYFLLKWLTLVFLGMLMFALASLLQNEIFYYVAVGLIFLVELFIYGIGIHIGNLSFLKYFNLISFLKTDGFFAYYNYNFFGWPLHMLETNLIGIIVLSIVFILFGMFVFVKYSCNYKSLRFKQIFVRKHFLRGICNMEGYKILYGNKVAIFIMIAIVFQMAVYSGKTARWYTTELDFKYYLKQIEGEVTAEKLDYIQAEKERFEELNAQYQVFEVQMERGEISESQFINETALLSKELQKQNGFSMVESYVEYIKALDCADKGFVYDRGWWYLAGSGNFNNDMKNGVLLVICLILALSGVIAQEYQYQMQAFIHIGRERRRSTFCKIGITGLLIVVIFTLVYVPEWLWVMKEYGLNGGSWAVYSLTFLSEFPIHCSITGYFLIIYLIRFVTALFMGGCILFLSRILKNTNLTIVVSAMLFLLPLLLHIINIQFIDSCSLNQFISGNMLF